MTSMGGYPNGLPRKIQERYLKFMEEGVSTIAIDNSNGLICGAMLSVMLTRYIKSDTL